jgi:microcystin-dependent protein
MPSDPYIGEISMFAGNFAIRGYALCQGQLMSIAQNTALFSILGTTYGGDGRVTFGLPDLRGRYPMGQGQGPGLSYRNLGEIGGSESVTLLTTQMPAHVHNFTFAPQGVTEAGDTASPAGAYPANTGALDREYKATGTFVNMGTSSGVTNPNGGSQPHDNMPPYLVINFLIALQGIFPSRN